MITKQKGIPSENYTRIPNSVIRDGSLSLSGIGLFCVLSSLPENWDLSACGLAVSFGFQKKEIHTYMRELVEKGYLVREQNRTGGKFTGYDYRICSKPHFVKPGSGIPGFGTPGSGIPGSGTPGCDISRQYNKRIIKEKNTKEKNNKHVSRCEYGDVEF